MPGPLLITTVALGLTCGLLYLRHCLVTCNKEPQPSYRAYIMWFAEMDGYADGDEDAEIDDILALRPSEIVGHARRFPRDCGHISTCLLPGRSLTPAHQPDKLHSQTTYHCPMCGQHAWATPTAQLLCGICKRSMQAYL
jgi:hypothetical protein